MNIFQVIVFLFIFCTDFYFSHKCWAQPGIISDFNALLSPLDKSFVLQTGVAWTSSEYILISTLMVNYVMQSYLLKKSNYFEISVMITIIIEWKVTRKQTFVKLLLCQKYFCLKFWNVTFNNKDNMGDLGNMWEPKGKNRTFLLSSTADIVHSILLPGGHKSEGVQLGAIKQIRVWKGWL